ncbi:MAG: hypothetical protein ACYTF7_11080, partial [Planctomycetota bacterium]
HIEDASTILTNGHTIYYRSLILEGANQTVDNQSNFVEIVGCFGDLSGDTTIDGADLGLLLSNWGDPGTTDLNGDGDTDGADLGLLLAAWGACP